MVGKALLLNKVSVFCGIHRIGIAYVMIKLYICTHKEIQS